MKRNLDLVREILLKLEEDDTAVLKIDGYSEDEIGHHIYLMGQAGLLNTVNVTSLESKVLIARSGMSPITWKGHDYLNNVR